MTEYTKPFLTFDEQANLLLERGMLGDHSTMVRHLKDVGYYRLSGYWHTFKWPDDTFKCGTTFDQVWKYYVFDRQLRLCVLDAIERVEIYFRTQLAYELAGKTGLFGYEDPANLPRLNDGRYGKFIARCKEAFDRSREPFVLHYKEKYGDCHELPPYWMLVNVMDFGLMLTLYRGASVDIRNKLAKDLGVSAKVLESWLVTLNTVRNICAHHGRLWNKRLGTVPKIPKNNEDVRWGDLALLKPDRVAGVLTILSYLLEFVAPGTHWRDRLWNLIGGQNEETLEKMGFMAGWKRSSFWKDMDLESSCVHEYYGG